MTAEEFTALRPRLLDVAYRVVGTVTDAEDVVQEAWLRWSAADRGGVENPEAFLVTVTTRLAIDRLRREKARREAYPGPWLPEPVSTEPGADERVELAESVELALLVVLETLSPLERAAFVLHEAFSLPYAEVAAIIGRTEPATRQLARRARDHVRERRPRFPAGPDRRRELTERFLAACLAGDLDALVALFVADVELVSDGGGRAKAPLRVMAGADRVGRFLTAISNEEGARHFLRSVGVPDAAAFALAIEGVNGAPAAVVRAAGRVVLVFAIEPAGDRIGTIFLLANPAKLAAMSR
ncbi:RNA polymerase sigma factor SigJ [Dactylosporangium sp. AC04546]|uniref:RNA polymerase sigma factor SigJ n=1 Tax=Dactylosporangium sp. AC04546 TaxID=2862460 RepID=UPI001EDDB863|nr:RNA polymerase sigma factor SigJ [Dactylosporangium sp. AC04546]WVK79973.1 RNA polymerase sigma factor SigJ [Dactylosporangium sp. AC04546]